MEPIIELIRIDASSQHGTFGVFQVQKIFRWPCLEPYHRENEKNISSIPAGMYRMKRVNSPRFGKTFEICDVFGRTHILIHSGNIDDNTQGCVLIGKQFAFWNDEEGIGRSRQAFKEFMNCMDGHETATLIIKECY